MQGISLDDFAFEHRGTTAAAFLAANPAPFLLVWENAPAEEQPASFRTVSSEATTGHDDGTHIERHLVFGVHRPGTPDRFMITVGRTENNDIYLPNPKVSKFHAYFQRDPESGAYRIGDAGSTNGTVHCSRRLGADEPVEVRDGDTLVFAGRYHATFYLPGTLFAVMGPLM